MSRAYMEDKDIIAFQNEVDIMLTLNENQGHPNILKIYHYFEDPKRYLLVTELCQGGELYKMALREKKFEPNRAAFILKQLLSAVNYMHTKNIVHRDLKPENILLEEKDDLGAMQTIKLIDFGTGKKFKDGELLTDRVGTPGYMAPEIYLETASYSKQCDMWSIGIIAYILLCGEQPFKNKDNDLSDIKNQVKNFKEESSAIF